MKFLMPFLMPLSLWWLIFWCNFIILKSTQIAGKTLLMGASVRKLPEEINIWIGKLSKADGPPDMWAGVMQSVKGLYWTKKVEEE